VLPKILQGQLNTPLHYRVGGHVIATKGKRIFATTPSLNISRPESVSVRETRFSRDKHLVTEEYMLLCLSGIRIPLRPTRYYASTILTKTLSTVCRLAFRGTCLFRQFCGYTLSHLLPCGHIEESMHVLIRFLSMLRRGKSKVNKFV
jgi:hypothetical protein